MKKSISNMHILSLIVFCLIVLVTSVSFAYDVTTLIVVRAADDSLWKSTCMGNTCSSFSLFPGRFGSQPTVTWDESINKFVLVGTASNSQVWRSTFSPNGNFDNNWTYISASSASPPGLASSASHDSNSTAIVSNVTLTDHTKAVPFNINSLSFSSPSPNGFYQCIVTGMISVDRVNTTGTNVAYLGVSSTSNALDAGTSNWTAIDIPDTTPVGMTSFPICVSKYYSSSASPLNIYAVAKWEGTSGGDPIYLRNVNMSCEFMNF
jgi:hypothetical protein